MLNFLSGTPVELGYEVMHQLAQYRYKVFIRELGWSLPTKNDLESDEFDRVDTHYVIATDSAGRIAGCGRLLPTNKPYLLGDVFPGLMCGAELPCHPQIWELSRFAISMPHDESSSAEDRWQNTCRLMSAIVRVAQRQGASRLIAFSVIGNERLLRRMGVNIHRAAAPQMIENKPTLPFWIEIDQKTLSALQIENGYDLHTQENARKAMGRMHCIVA